MRLRIVRAEEARFQNLLQERRPGAQQSGLNDCVGVHVTAVAVVHPQIVQDADRQIVVVEPVEFALGAA